MCEGPIGVDRGEVAGEVLEHLRHVPHDRGFIGDTQLKHDPRHVDFMWPIWAILDCTPAGRSEEWGPSLAYPRDGR